MGGTCRKVILTNQCEREHEIHLYFCIHCQGWYESSHTERITRGAGDKRGGRGKEKPMGNRGMRRPVKGRGMGRGTQGKQDGHLRNIQVLTRQGLSGRKAGNLKEVGLG